MVTAGFMAFINNQDVEGAANPGTCLPESKGGTNCDPSVVKSMYESNEDTNVYTDGEKLLVAGATQMDDLINGWQHYTYPAGSITSSTGTIGTASRIICSFNNKLGLFKLSGYVFLNGSSGWTNVYLPFPPGFNPPTSTFDIFAAINYAIVVTFPSPYAGYGGGHYNMGQIDLRLQAPEERFVVSQSFTPSTRLHFPSTLYFNDNFGAAS